MKIISIVLATGLILIFANVTVFSSEYEEHQGKDYQKYKKHEMKVYGTIESIPEGTVGTWIVSGREIYVTKGTKIEEEYGRVEVGAYVEVEGGYSDKTFVAHEIEVKRAKR